MSLLNISFLNEAINEKNILQPNMVFNHVRKRLIVSVSQSGRQDGMDGVLICIDSGKISYASANNPPVLISKGVVVDLPYDKMPIGKGEKTDHFQLFGINYEKGDMLYLCTDGYADQFGGDKGKKFKTKKLDQLIRYAQKKHGLSRVLIVDWDVHHGNGTQHSFEDDPSVLFFSTHQYPHYPGTGREPERGRGEGEGYTINVPMEAGEGDDEYRAIFQKVLMPAAEEFKPELVIISAGFDAHKDDPLAGMGLTESGYAELTGIVAGIAQKTCGWANPLLP